MRTRSQIGKHSRRKGQTWEREVARRLREALGLDADTCKRGIGQARSAGEVPDVVLPGWWLECKHGKKVNYRAAMKQALAARCPRSPAQAMLPLKPVACICRDNCEAPVVVMLLDEWLAMIVAKKEP